MNIEDLMVESHLCSLSKGWWDNDREMPEQIALFHSEISEALEEYRSYGLDPDHYIYYLPQTQKPEGLAVELADLLIRVCDTCQRYNIPLVKALEVKMAYNKTRSYRHGAKLC